MKFNAFKTPRCSTLVSPEVKLLLANFHDYKSSLSSFGCMLCAMLPTKTPRLEAGGEYLKNQYAIDYSV
jgi:hypothetical protein